MDLVSLWQPAEDITVSEWAERHRILAPETSAEPGPWRNIRTPYLKAVMDAYSDPYIETIVVNKGSQLGFTECIYNMLGYTIDQDPAPTLVVMPTIELAKYASKNRIQPMINLSSTLRAKKPLNDDDFTVLEMRLAGMVLTIGGANSPASLASRPERNVFFDEINKYPQFSGNEANPISLGKERQKTFWNKKTVLGSTPTMEDGPITVELSLCDVILNYHVPCPHCGKAQRLVFPQIKWPKELDSKDPNYVQLVRDTAWYECEYCQGMISNLHRPELIRNGEWIEKERKSDNPRSVGFDISSLYSPWLTWGDIAEAFLKSKDWPEKLMNFVNSWLAEPWVQRIAAAKEETILQARCDLPPQTVPQETIALTAGIDVQMHGFWFVVRAWAKDYTSWLIHYGFLASWEEIEQILFGTGYPVQGSDKSFRISRAAIDTGGGGDDDRGVHLTEETYWWLRKNGRGRGCFVRGTKGSSQPLQGKLHAGKPLDRTPSGKPIPGGLQIVLIDTDKCKDMYHYRIGQALEHQPQGAYLHSGTDDVYARQITAEEKRRDKKGREEWVRIRKDNHLLDCEVLAMACADPEWPEGGVHLFRNEPQARTEPLMQTIRQSESRPWLGRRGGWLKR